MHMRRWIAGFAIVFAVVVGVSFTFGVYLLFKRNSPGLSRRASPALVVEVDQGTLLAAAAAHLKEGQTEQALIVYRQVLSMNPSSVEAQLGLAQSELRAGREGIAQRELERTLELKPDDRVALLELARVYSHRVRTWPLAELKYREYLKQSSDDSQAWLELARTLAWQRKSAEAADIFTRNAVSARMNDKDWRDYAFALVRSGRLEQAVSVLSRLTAKQPQDFELRLQLASIHASRRNWEAALPIYESLLREKPSDPGLNLTFGLGLLSIKRYKEALGPLERARNAMPASGEAGLGLARAFKGVGDLKKADREFERALGLYRDDASVVREYADLLLERENYGKSERYYREAHRLGLRDDRLLVGFAGALSGSRKYKEALPYLEQAHERQPTDRLAFELAKIYQRLGRNDRALALIANIESRR